MSAEVKRIMLKTNSCTIPIPLKILIRERVKYLNQLVYFVNERKELNPFPLYSRLQIFHICIVDRVMTK